MRPSFCLVIAVICSSACAPTPDHEVDAQRTWSFAEATVFPADRSLVRPEDGVVLPNSTLLVADQTHGLIALSPDGSTTPFGEFADAGYVHEPPDRKAGPNGVALDPDGKHVRPSTCPDLVMRSSDWTSKELRSTVPELCQNYRQPSSINGQSRLQETPV